MKDFAFDLHTLTTEEIEAMLEEARMLDESLSVNIPATRDGVASFWSQFRCTRCGRCCDGTTPHKRGVITITRADFNRLKRHMKAKKLRRVSSTTEDGTLALPVPCPFYSKETKPTCKVYNARPDICRLYPLQDVVGIPPTLTVDPYCPGACNLIRDKLLAEKEAEEKEVGK